MSGALMLAHIRNCTSASCYFVCPRGPLGLIVTLIVFFALARLAHGDTARVLFSIGALSAERLTGPNTKGNAN
jgi:hypothetical protein